VRPPSAPGIALKQAFAREGKQLRRKAGGYGHAKQFRRLRPVPKGQRTILGVVIRDVRRGLKALLVGQGSGEPQRAKAISDLTAGRSHSKDKLYAMHAPEVECIGKGKARKPYEFGVKASIAVTHRPRGRHRGTSKSLTEQQRRRARQSIRVPACPRARVPACPRRSSAPALVRRPAAWAVASWWPGAGGARNTALVPSRQ
jgi:hypothetical protein